MRKRYKVTVNNETFNAYRGDVLLDAAMKAGIDLPHDCRAGQCGSCAIQLIDGQVYCGSSNDPRHVLACQSRIIGDVEFVVEDLPAVDSVKGRVSAITQLTSEVVEVRIETVEPRSYLPGQYFRVTFRGFPQRCYSPTVPMDRASSGRHAFHLHIRRIPDGRVSSALGRQIRKDHPVTITGPYGSAFLRPNLTSRLMLVASGTGFAPIWSIATAALTENPKREMIVIVGGKTLESLYMARALQRLAQYANVKIIPTVSAPQKFTKSVRQGRPIDHMQVLAEDDIVYACGAPSMVAAVRELAAAAGASCYAAAFVPQSSGNEQEGVVSRALSWITRDGEESLLARTLSWITGDSAAAMPPEPSEERGEKGPSRGLREPEPGARPAPQLRAAPRLPSPHPSERQQQQRGPEQRLALPPPAEQRVPPQHRPGPPRSAPAYPPPVDLPQLSWMPGNPARSMPPEPEFDQRSAPHLRAGPPPAPRSAPQPLAEQRLSAQHRPAPPPRSAPDYLPPIDLPPLSWMTGDSADPMPPERMEEPEEQAPFRSFREPEPAPSLRPAPPLWDAPPVQQYQAEPAPSPFAEPSPHSAPAYRPPVEPPLRAMNWVIGDSNPPPPLEPMEEKPDEETPFPSFREPEPTPRPARPVWAAPRRAELYRAEPEPTPQPMAEQRLAPQPGPAPQPQPQPASPPVEMPSRSAPVQLRVPPRSQPRPQPPAQPQADARPTTASQPHSETLAQLREVQPPARKTRPVFIFIPNESQAIHGKPEVSSMRHGDAEASGERLVPSQVPAGNADKPLGASSERPERSSASIGAAASESATTENVGTPSNRSDDDAGSAVTSVRAGGGGSRVFRLT
jgi:NAD(P)H-flavin reductase/ferredoxin